MSDIGQIKKSHAELKEMIVEKFGIKEDLDETAIKNKLRGKGWTSKEIDFYREFTQYGLLLITESLNMVYNVLTYRYSSLSLKFDIKGIAKTILNTIILEALEYHISTAGDPQTIGRLYYMKDNNERTRMTLDRILSSIEAIEEHNPYLNRFTNSEGQSLMALICSMVAAPQNIVEDYISKVKSDLKVFGAEWMQGGDDTHFSKGLIFKNSYKETRRILGRKLSLLSHMCDKSS